MLPPIPTRIATELSVRPEQVSAAIALLDEGATVPFIARYRKEATGSLDDTALRALEERLGYLRELEERRATVLAGIEEQGKMTPALRASLDSAPTKQQLEDLYLPYKPKRRSKAQIAREAGLEPLADALLGDPMLAPEAEAAKYLREPFTTADGDHPGVPDAKAALDGARQILMDRFAEDAALLGELREELRANGVVVSSVADGKEAEGAKFRDYFDYREPFARIPPHRALALFRGRREEVLRVELRQPEELQDAVGASNSPAPVRRVGGAAAFTPCERLVAVRFGIADRGRPADPWLVQAVRWTWTVKLAWSIASDLFAELRERAEEEAIRVFARNLHDLLLAAPAGQRPVMGLDPGIRTGVKVAVVDATGKVLDTATVYPHEPRRDWDGSIRALASLVRQHAVELVAIGNGTASRETDRLVADLLARHPDLALTKATVSEAGASVYSASELAAHEFPDLDVSLRGAVSIARRLQDPLAELVKIDPRSIGVGQYQHDVMEAKLARALDAVVEDCVNAVGVDVNTASAQLLARISGLSPLLAENIVRHRDANGPFPNRKALRKVPRLGEKTFVQAAGFLRIMNGDTPLDASAVHPEAYPVVERMIADTRRSIGELIGNTGALRKLEAARFVDERFGLPTVQDILRELEKPGRDPRPEFRTARFREGVSSLADLEPGMKLEGIVTNVTNFGAFVDIGVHQDGLVHISAMNDRFVRDPREIVKAGDVVEVKVLEVDLARKRIALTMRMSDEAPRPGDRRTDRASDERRGDGRRSAKVAGPDRERSARGAESGGAMAQALARALKR